MSKKKSEHIAMSLTDVRKTFIQGTKTLEVLKGVSFEIKQGEIVALVGQSGAGKSTLLQMAGLLECPTSGRVMVEGIDASTAGDSARTNLRGRTIGFIYQSHNLMPEFTAVENVVLPQLVIGIPKDRATKRAQELLDSVGLSHRFNHVPAKMSGGEQQRVAIARSMANNPAILLADEPTGSLDEETAERVFQTLLDMTKKTGLSALIATHNLDLAKRMDRTITLHNGVLV